MPWPVETEKTLPAFRNKTRLSRISSKTSVRDLWDAVRQLSGRKQQQVDVEGVTAGSLNQHDVNISTDPTYQPPQCKLTVARRAEGEEVITEFRMFEILDKLQNTATGLDLLPAWFLRLGLVYSADRSPANLTGLLLPPRFPSSGRWQPLRQFPRSPRHGSALTSNPFLSRQFSSECSSELPFESSSIQHF